MRRRNERSKEIVAVLAPPLTAILGLTIGMTVGMVLTRPKPQPHAVVLPSALQAQAPRTHPPLRADGGGSPPTAVGF
jgi:hypothetical protein